MAILILSSIVCSEQADPLFAREIAGIGTAVAKASSAPGYCSSSGGSTTYEYISSVSYTNNPSGTMTITVNVYITNSCGCTYGEPCGCYDNSPEYVNVWIDWDDDKVFEADEKVIDDALTGYTNINYRGTMTSSHLVSIPSGAVNHTWMRANLGWGTDPNDPCLSSWTWGNVVDKVIGTLTPPRIESIKVEGKDAAYKNDPVANKEVKLTATIKEESGFEIYKIKWWGDVTVGEGTLATRNPYTYKPAKGTHGKKTVSCTIYYKNLDTGETGTRTLRKEFKLFFIKDDDDDGNADNGPNWFQYWMRDGPVPNMAGALYDKTTSSYGRCTGAGQVYLGKKAAGQHYTNAIVLNTARGTESFGGPTVKGIDCAAEVIAHELYHKWVGDQWKAGGSFNGKTDSDKGIQCGNCDDRLPDFYENSTSLTNNNDTDTYDVATAKGVADYVEYGDEEYMAMRAGDGSRGDKTKDWANPGKQTSTVYSLSVSEIYGTSGTLSGKLTGTYSSQGNDTDSDGLYNYLKVSAGVNVTSGGILTAVAILRDSNGNQITYKDIELYLSEGIRTINFDFDGIKIRESAKNGPYTVNITIDNEYSGGGTLEGNISMDSGSYTTSSYTYTQFQTRAADFSGSYTDQGVDLDIDSIYDQLNVNVGLTVVTAGTYNLEGWLYDSDGNDIVSANKSSSLTAGASTITLNFNGTKIGNHRKNGPYSLMYLELTDSSDEQVQLTSNPYNTSSYSYTDFKKQTGVSRLTDTYTDQGTDLDLNGLYDYLTVGIGLYIETAGDYRVTATLYDSNGTMISDTSNKFSLTAGSQSVELNLDGLDIYNNGVDGPYTLKYVIFETETGDQLDYASDAHTTSAYNYTDFASAYIVSLTGNYLDYGTDLDSNSLYDYLTVDVEVTVVSDGNCIISARLVDSNENEITSASNTSYLTAGQPQILRLNFNGTSINANGVNGPYYVKDLYVYHTGDPEQSKYLENAHTTQAYSYTDFEGGAECTLIGDYPPCGTIALSEVIDFINKWSQGQAQLSDVIDLINAWASG